MRQGGHITVLDLVLGERTAQSMLSYAITLILFQFPKWFYFHFYVIFYFGHCITLLIPALLFFLHRFSSSSVKTRRKEKNRTGVSRLSYLSISIWCGVREWYYNGANWLAASLRLRERGSSLSRLSCFRWGTWGQCTSTDVSTFFPPSYDKRQTFSCLVCPALA